MMNQIPIKLKPEITDPSLETIAQQGLSVLGHITFLRE